MPGTVFQIPDENLPKLREKIAKLSKRAEKLTGEKIHLMEIGFQDNEKDNGAVNRVWEVFIAGPEPKLNGYEFVARIDHANEVGNIVRSVPGSEIPGSYREANPNCDHCGHNRYRRDTFIVRNTETGEHTQVGSSCLKDFLGHGDPQKMAKLAELYGFANEYATAATEREVGVDYRFIGLETFGAHVICMVRNFGWTPKSKAWEERPATVARALGNMFPGRHETVYEPTDQDYEHAQQAMEWAQSLPENKETLSDYEYNINVISASGVIEMRSTGLAASIFGVWYNRNVKDTGLPNIKNSTHQGQVKERIERRVQVLFTKVCDSFYGPSTLHKLADENGNCYVWFNSGSKDLQQGESVKIRGTVKKHDSYNGVQQTTLNRVKVIEE